MKISKFIRDLFTTGFTQIAVLLMGIILLRIMATALSKDYFGIFMIMRRIIAIGGGLITLNLGVGLARYVSYKKEREKEFLNVSLLTTTFLSILTIIIFSLFRVYLSKIFFNASNFSIFVVLLSFYIFSYGIFTITYAFFRGRQNMDRANLLRFLYYLLPVILALILWIIFANKYSQILIFYYFLFALGGILLSTAYLKKNLAFNIFRKIKKYFQNIKNLFFYSFSRIPSIFFLTLTFGIPVFFATHKISLEAAGYVGIAVSVVRLMEIFAAPFNLLFLPKFAEIKRNHNSQEIKHKVSIVVDFIISALPIFAVLGYGLAKYIVIIFFGQKYITAVPSVSLVILFSVFYLAYALLRGILDGLFSFPYVNLICLSGFLVTTITSALSHENISLLALDFGLGLFFMGMMALYILIKKGNVSLETNKLLISFLLILFSFLISLSVDRWIGNLIMNEYLKFGILILYRALLLLFLFLFYWKPKSLWFREFLHRVEL